MPKRPSRTVPTARLADAQPVVPGDTRIWPGHTVDVDGVQVHVRTTPTDAVDAEPALFVHGLAGSAHNWTDLAGALRDRLAIDSIDLLGHGRTGPAPGNDYSLGAHARMVIAYLDQTDRGPVHLAGNSMGGAVSVLVAAQRPDLIRTLTLISPAVPDNRFRVYPLRNDPMMALVVVPVLGEWAMKHFNGRHAAEARVGGSIKLVFADKSRYPEQRFQEAVEEAQSREGLDWAESSVLRSMRALATSQFLRGRSGWATMRKITSPTAVIWGDKDRLVAPDLAPFVAAAIPDSRLLELSDIGHTAMMEDPVTTARAMIGLIEDAKS